MVKHWNPGLCRDVLELPSMEVLRKRLDVALSAVVWVTWWCLVKAWTQLWKPSPALMISLFEVGLHGLKHTLRSLPFAVLLGCVMADLFIYCF